VKDDLKRYRDELDRQDRSFTSPSRLNDLPEGSHLVESSEIDLPDGTSQPLKHPLWLSSREMRSIYKKLPRHPGSLPPRWDEGDLRKTGKPVAASQRGSTDIGRDLVLTPFYAAALHLLCAVQDVLRDPATVDDCRKAAERLLWELAWQCDYSRSEVANHRRRDRERTPWRLMRREDAHYEISEILVPRANTVANAVLRTLEGPEPNAAPLRALVERLRAKLVDKLQQYMDVHRIEALTYDGRHPITGARTVNQPTPLEAQRQSKMETEKLIWGEYQAPGIPKVKDLGADAKADARANGWLAANDPEYQKPRYRRDEREVLMSDLDRMVGANSPSTPDGGEDDGE